MAAKSTEWRPGPTVCRCCLAEGCYKDISTEYFWMGKREVYAEMMSDTFDLSIAFSQSGGPNSNSRLICEPCIARLRDASDFKRQVQECERTFMQYLDPRPAGPSVTDIQINFEDEKEVKLELVKEEKRLSDDDDFDDRPEFGDDPEDSDDLDDQPLTKLASKIPKKESVDVLDLLDNAKLTGKRKSSSKSKGGSAKKAKTKKEVASSSKEKPEPRKKKVDDTLVAARHNAKVVLKYTTAYPFRIPGENLVCVYCWDGYDDPEQYRAHIRQEHKSSKINVAFSHAANVGEFLKVDCVDLSCRICDQPFDNISSIAKHLLQDHNKDIKSNCEVGMQMFKLGAERWACALCEAKLISLRELSRHTSTHYHKYTCEICGKSYVSGVNLQRHKMYGHSQYKYCIKCKKCFRTAEERRAHVLSSQKCWQMTCNLCGQRFVTRNSRIEHLEQVHGQAPKNHPCPECGMVFEKQHHYRAHFIASHTNNSFVCKFCDQKFASKHQLSMHIVKHTKEKAFVCSVCSKSFSRKKNLIQHSWIHSEVKRFGCDTCNKTFNQRVTYKAHMKNYHADVTDY